MEKYKSLDPANIRFLGFRAVVSRVDCVANLIEQLRLLPGWKADRGNSSGASPGMAGRVGRVGVFLDNVSEGFRNP